MSSRPGKEHKKDEAPATHRLHHVAQHTPGGGGADSPPSTRRHRVTTHAAAVGSGIRARSATVGSRRPVKMDKKKKKKAGEDCTGSTPTQAEDACAVPPDAVGDEDTDGSDADAHETSATDSSAPSSTTAASLTPTPGDSGHGGLQGDHDRTGAADATASAAVAPLVSDTSTTESDTDGLDDGMAYNDEFQASPEPSAATEIVADVDVGDGHDPLDTTSLGRVSPAAVAAPDEVTDAAAVSVTTQIKAMAPVDDADTVSVIDTTDDVKSTDNGDTSAPLILVDAAENDESIDNSDTSPPLGVVGTSPTEDEVTTVTVTDSDNIQASIDAVDTTASSGTAETAAEFADPSTAVANDTARACDPEPLRDAPPTHEPASPQGSVAPVHASGGDASKPAASAASTSPAHAWPSPRSVVDADHATDEHAPASEGRCSIAHVGDLVDRVRTVQLLHTGDFDRVAGAAEHGRHHLWAGDGGDSTTHAREAENESTRVPPPTAPRPPRSSHVYPTLANVGCRVDVLGVGEGYLRYHGPMQHFGRQYGDWVLL